MPANKPASCCECGIALNDGLPTDRDWSQFNDGRYLCRSCETNDEDDSPTDADLVYVFGDMSYGTED